MKRLIALVAAFVFMVIIGTTLNIAQATPLLQATETSTATPTVTETSSEPTDPCDPLPEMITQLQAPQNKAVFAKKTRIKLKWSAVECANKYRILVRRDSRKGPPAARGKTTKTKFFVELAPGHKYFWDIKSCKDKICDRSSTIQFTLGADPNADVHTIPNANPQTDQQFDAGTKGDTSARKSAGQRVELYRTDGLHQ